MHQSCKKKLIFKGNQNDAKSPGCDDLVCELY